MNITFPEYKGSYKIVSLALDNTTKEDLQLKGLPLIYAYDGRIQLLPDDIILSNLQQHIDGIYTCNNYDVFEIWEDGSLHRKYNDSSDDNYLFITGKCNSNCIMCPSPDNARKNATDTEIGDLFELAKHIPSDVSHLTITGGEPFMIGEQIFKLFAYLKDKFINTEFLILTNGRIFAVDKYCQEFSKNGPANSIIAIPLHGSCPEVHDKITRTKNSFHQTLRGIKQLLQQNIKVELRLVVNLLNVEDFLNIANLISHELKGISYVSIIAMEMTGNARVYKDSIWVSYKSSFGIIKPAIRLLIENGIDVRLYNFPLCTVEKSFWLLCEKSISPDKVRFSDTCNVCRYRGDCSGVFAGTLQYEKDELGAII